MVICVPKHLDVVHNLKGMRIVFILLMMVTFCSIAQAQQSGIIHLMTPEMSFDSDRFIVCVESLADSVRIWEEEKLFEGASPSSVSLETCTSLFATSYLFEDQEGRLLPEAWLLTWEQWMAAMAAMSGEDIMKKQNEAYRAELSDMSAKMNAQQEQYKVDIERLVKNTRGYMGATLSNIGSKDQEESNNDASNDDSKIMLFDK